MERVTFRRVVFLPTETGFDYPLDLPIPRVGEGVQFNEYSGTVSSVKHAIERQEKGLIAVIKITVIPF